MASTPPPPTYDVRPSERAPPGRAIIIDDDDDEESIDCTEPAHWGMKAECSMSPRQLIGCFACAMMAYMLNAAVYHFLK